VDENATGTLASYGFKQSVSSGSTAYQYDANGNLAYDLNKNMDITYNHLNLPERIEFDDCKVIEFTYDANGAKLRKELKNGAMLLSNHEYLGSIEYEGSELRNIYHEEGRVYYEGGNGRYEYNIRDHLGNTRLTFTDRDNDGTIEVSSDPEVNEVLQENHYYPFGMAMDGQWMANPGREDKYQYNGKELHDDFGLGWYAYGARFYDPVIARFTGVDPIADRFPWVSTYNYAENEPIANIDLHGLQKLSFQELVTRALEAFGLDGKTLKEGPRDQEHANSISTVRKNAENLKKGAETLIDIQTSFVPGGSLMNPNADGGDVAMDFAGIIFPGLKIIDKSNTAFKIAAEGGNHSGFLKNYLGKTAEQLQKGIDSFNKQIQKHLDKIDNPSKEIADFDKLDIRQQQHLVEKKWPSDIKRLKEQKDILQGLLDNVNSKE